jgi:fatty acid elongase 3
MAPLADFLLAYAPLPRLPDYLVHYVPGQTPLSTQKEVGTALVTYLAVIFGIQHIMRDRKPIRANGLFQVHNVILTVGSGLVLALMVEEIAPILWKGGLFYAMCNDDSWTPVSICHC